MATKVVGAPDDRRGFWAGIAASAGWCIALVAGLPLLLGVIPGLPAARWTLVAAIATGVALVVSGEFSRRIRLPRS